MIELIISSSALILAILLIRKITKGKISMKMRYALWIPVALRLLMPMPLGNTAFSVMNFVPGAEESPLQGFALPIGGGTGADGRFAPDAAGVWNASGTDASEMQSVSGTETSGMRNASGTEAAGMQNASGTDAIGTQSASGTDASGMQNMPETGAEKDGAGGNNSMRPALMQMFSQIYAILHFVWLAGVIVSGGHLFFSQFRFVRYLKRNRQEFPERRLPREWRERLSERNMKVYRMKGLPSPCLVGKNIYVSTERMEEEKLRHILAHEYCHARQHDTFWALLRSLFTAVYWFHPLVWAAAFAAKQDSELACDEAAVALLGEEKRYAYGRTLVYLLSNAGGRGGCIGVTLTMDDKESRVRERVSMIAKKTSPKTSVVVLTAALVLAACSCAFTGGQTEEQERTEGLEPGSVVDTDTIPGVQITEIDRQEEVDALEGQLQQELDALQEAQTRTQAEADALREAETAARQAQEDAAFAEALNYQGCMAGRDDSVLEKNLQLDIQAYDDYVTGKQENPPENNWYLLCRSGKEGAKDVISIYGLFTKEFGCRGIKTLIDGDVNTFDFRWAPSYRNADSGNIRILERENGLPRSFAFTIMEQVSSSVEKWSFYVGYRYDTGALDLQRLDEETYLSWVDKNLDFELSDKKDKVFVLWDMVLGEIDLSAYTGKDIEAVTVDGGAVDFLLSEDDSGFSQYGIEGLYQDDTDGMYLVIAAGVKLADEEGIWTDGLKCLCIRISCDYTGAGGGFSFELDAPRILQNVQVTNQVQRRALEGDTLLTPLVSGYAHHDVEVTFSNPCPSYTRISNAFGERTNPATGEKRMHNGIDMAAPEGSEVKAAADGTVYKTGWDAVNGNFVVLWHSQSGQMTYYMHCKEILVKENDTVANGQQIATVGKTGSATGAILHFALSSGDEWQEPVWGQRNRETE